MKDILNKVRGAVATKDLVPVLTYFHIYDGRIQGGNNLLAIDSAYSEMTGIDVTVAAEDFIKAVDACDEEFYITIDDDKMLVEKGRLKIKLPIYDNKAYPKVDIATKGKNITGFTLEQLAKLRPFVGTDATRPWACGILIEEGYLSVTNNVVLARTPCNVKSKTRYNVPSQAIDELLRLDDQPKKIVANDDHIGFIFKDDYWMRSKLLSPEWPDTGPLFAGIKGKLPAVDENLLPAIESILPFVPDKKFPEIVIGEDGVSTGEGKKSAARSGIKNLSPAKFRAEPLMSVLQVATHIDFKPYPGPCPFRGDGIEGVIIGIRDKRIVQ